MPHPTIDRREIDVNGFVEIPDNPISAVGIYQYINPPGAPDPDKIYRVFRSPEELSRQETLDSLKLMPLVDDHPKEPGMLGDKDNAIAPEEKGIHGVIGEQVYFDADSGFIKGNIKIHSAELLEKINIFNKKELSAGYWAEYDYTPGEWNGQEYDAVQYNILFNHVALVDYGRMGSQVSVQDQQDLSPQTNEAHMHDTAKLAELKQAVAALATLLNGFFSEEASEGMGTADSDDTEEEKEKTEDSDDTEEKEKTEDSEEEEKEEKKEGSMDSDVIKSLIDRGVAKALADIKERDSLYSRIKPHVGVMDASEMTVEQLADYAIKKLNLKLSGLNKVDLLKGYLSGLDQSTGTQDSAPIPESTQSFSYKDFE